MRGTARTRGEQRWQQDGTGGPGSAPHRASPAGPGWLLAAARWHGRGHRWPPRPRGHRVSGQKDGGLGKEPSFVFVLK